MSAHTKRLKRYCEMRERFPMKQIGDGLHIIQAGTEFEAEVRLSDLRLLLAENEKLREAIKPFLDVLENDVGQDEADADFFRPMNTHNRAERLRVGHFRALRAALGEPQ